MSVVDGDDDCARGINGLTRTARRHQRTRMRRGRRNYAQKPKRTCFATKPTTTLLTRSVLNVAVLLWRGMSQRRAEPPPWARKAGGLGNAHECLATLADASATAHKLRCAIYGADLIKTLQKRRRRPDSTLTRSTPEQTQHGRWELERTHEDQLSAGMWGTRVDAMQRSL